MWSCRLSSAKSWMKLVLPSPYGSPWATNSQWVVGVESGFMGSSCGHLKLLLIHGGNLIWIKSLRVGLKPTKQGSVKALEKPYGHWALQNLSAVSGSAVTVSLCHESDGLCRNCWLELYSLSQILTFPDAFGPPLWPLRFPLQDMLCVPERRLLEDSKNLPISASTNRSDRILLFDDVLVLIQVSLQSFRGIGRAAQISDSKIRVPLMLKTQQSLAFGKTLCRIHAPVFCTGE